MNEQIGNSTEVDRVVDQFDFTVMSDFMIHYGSGLNVIISVVLVCILVYVFVHIYLTGGFSNFIVRGYKGLHRDDFFAGANKYFTRFVRLELLFFGIYILLFGMANFSFMEGGLDPFKLESDTALINRFLWCNGIALVLIFFVRIIHDSIKLCIVDSEKAMDLSLNKKSSLFC